MKDTMNDAGRNKLWNALLYGSREGEPGIGIHPITYQKPEKHHEMAEVLVRSTTGENPTIITLSALASAGLLHISDSRSQQMQGEDTPQFELLTEQPDKRLSNGDKVLMLVDRTVVPN